MQVRSHFLKTIHFIGIGGIGMSGIAEILHNLGFIVQGSDSSSNANTKRLEEKGVKVFIGHESSNVQTAQVVVISTAIKSNNPELLQARLRKIPVVKRAEMLAEIMHLKHGVAVSGTHGKTTTTSLIAALFDAADLDPTVINGGILNTHGTNAYLGKGEWVIAEADESDGSFLKLPATIAVVTNIDPEHMDFYKDFETLKSSFKQFIEKLPFYGLGILCTDHTVVKDLSESITDRRIVTYGLEEGAQIRGVNLCFSPQGVKFDVEILEGLQAYCSGLKGANVVTLPKKIKDLYLPMVGAHNVQNALTLVAIAREMGFGEEVIRKALLQFKGVKRRFTLTATVNGVQVIDDYAHHPEEIKKVLEAAKNACSGKIYAVVQPHRYSRLKDLFEDFVTCVTLSDAVFIAPIYAAGETSIEGLESTTLVEAMTQKKVAAQSTTDVEDLAKKLSPLLKEGDMVLLMGAGSITQWAYELPAILEELLGSKTMRQCS